MWTSPRLNVCICVIVSLCREYDIVVLSLGDNNRDGPIGLNIFLDSDTTPRRLFPSEFCSFILSKWILDLVCYAMRENKHLHIHLSVVDQVLQRIGAWVVVLQLSVIRHSACCDVFRLYNSTDVNRLDVGEVWEYACPYTPYCLWRNVRN